MKIIPAIDLINGKVVRLEVGRFDKVKIYTDDPVEKAKEWSDLGAKLLHVVDLDGAKIGKPQNFDVIKKIADSTELDIEMGGGLRDEKNIAQAFSLGIKYAVVGTSAVQDSGFCTRMIKKYKNRIVFAVDVKDGKVAIKGWQESSDTDVAEYLSRLEKMGAKTVIYTDISKDGMMAGPNIAVLKEILSSTSLDVIASGGVSRLADIKVLKGLEKDGLKGVIIGKALYEGKIDLKEAFDVV
ncbi:MAG: 1-(5-phosphoribosyl)-5-[(5-phosphoribosylamino)methylideneamino]imidazole-4-carboxamide isomerase [Candidatus Omnitrophica bacterium]|nr:1-(5-phosphoribosyl)-5-[(5-phosphoribosylamino)methylideneamino]imidazole-4-carboxamide isomerase [Candidatus Omnitrophota bacterium]